jgi:hypothetical protein
VSLANEEGVHSFHFAPSHYFDNFDTNKFIASPQNYCQPRADSKGEGSLFSIYLDRAKGNKKWPPPLLKVIFFGHKSDSRMPLFAPPILLCFCFEMNGNAMFGLSNEWGVGGWIVFCLPFRRL